MKIENLWKNYKFPNCENCKRDCGKYEYDNLCSNLNYLKNYGDEYYERMKESFAELAKVIKDKIVVFSFGCGCSLDYLAGKEIFENNFSYFGVDECEWAVKDTSAYKNLDEYMPKKNLNYYEGLRLLSIVPNNAVICFFNSLNDIMNNKKDLKKDLLETMSIKTNFQIICNYTRGGNHTLAWNEECFLKDLCKNLRSKFQIKQLEILNGEGIIISGTRK